jgi:antitoxin component YwqK of YwqJK toxin-antitoxin module
MKRQNYKLIIIIFLFSFLINCSDYFTQEDIFYKEDKLYFKDSTLFTGELRSYYPVTDEIQLVEKYKNGKRDGDLIQYYKNGFIKEKISYKNGKKNGYHTSYFTNGNIGCIKGYKNV